MGNSIPAEVTVFFDDSGGTPRDVTQYCLGVGDFAVSQGLEEKHSFGDSWEESLPFGVGKVDDFDMTFLYDDTANGPVALFLITAPDTPASITRTLKVQWKTTGGTKSSQVETLRLNCKTKADRNGLTKMTATVRPTGATTET